jgi:hypothetical protein
LRNRNRYSKVVVSCRVVVRGDGDKKL